MASSGLQLGLELGQGVGLVCFLFILEKKERKGEGQLGLLGRSFGPRKKEEKKKEREKEIGKNRKKGKRKR